MGWSLSLGRLLAPEDVLNDYDFWQWVYIGADGADHVFYQGLHTTGPPGVDPCATATCFTRDESYLRMQRISATERWVEFPDGTRHVFTRFALPNGGFEWRVTAIRDRFEDGLIDLEIGYSADANT
jgi:hypothetical protein